MFGYTIRVFQDYGQPELHAGMGHPIDYGDNTGSAYVLGNIHIIPYRESALIHCSCTGVPLFGVLG